MKSIIKQFRRVIGCIFVAILISTANTSANAGMLVELNDAPFGTYHGVEYVRYTGRFVGSTPSGEYRVPFEIVAPANPHQGNGTVVFEPPHFQYGTGGRDNVLGPDLLFDRRFSHASVGFSDFGFNLLDPSAEDAIIAGQPATVSSMPGLRDVQILKQFVEALTTDPNAIDILGHVHRRYGYGVSQTAEALNELFYGSGGAGLFDLVVLHVPVWRPPFAPPSVLDVLPDPFVPLSDIGKVMLVSAEGDLLIGQSMQLRNALTEPTYRLYEVAGAPHLALDVIVQEVQLNPLDVSSVVRAAFVAGDRWVRHHRSPPASQMLGAAGAGEIDPVYRFETGIARDTNLNATGGVRFPDVENGRAFHIAAALDVEVIPGFAGLVGAWFDLACAPLAGATEPRFRSHRQYVQSVKRQSRRLVHHGYLLRNDARALIRKAVESDVGKRGSCGPLQETGQSVRTD